MNEKATIQLSEIEIIPIKPRNGLLAFASFLLNGQFFCGNIALYSRPDGSLRLVYPQKILQNGKTVNCFHPINQPTAMAVLEQVSEAYLRLVSRCDENVATCEDKNGSRPE